MQRVLPIFDCCTKITDDYVLTRLKTMGKLAMLMLKDLDQAFKKERYCFN